MNKRHQMSAGGVVFRRCEDATRFLLILDRHGNWGFPKGHLEKGESRIDAASREVTEETGLTGFRLLGPVLEIEWEYREGRSVVRKRCEYFLFESSEGDVRPQLEEGISEYAWARLEEAETILTFDNAREVLAAAAAMMSPMEDGEQ